MFKELPDILTISQVAAALGVGIKAAYALIHQHRLGCVYMGRTIKVPKFCLKEFVKSARNNVKL